MEFRFDKGKAQPPVRVSWRLNAQTLARLDEVAKEEGVRVEEVAQQALDHAMRERRGRRQS